MSKLIKIKNVDSTNEWLKRNVDKLEDLDCVVAGAQSEGKGRGSKRWFSPYGGLWMSVLIKEFQWSGGELTQLISVVVSEVLEKYGLNISLKWPNDIFLEKKKLGGILTEKKSDSFIVGVGINLNLKISDFPGGLKDNSITVWEILGKEISIEQLAGKIIRRIKNERNNLERIHALYISMNQDIGKMVKIESENETITGRVTNIQTDGGLVLEKGEEKKTFYSGSLHYINSL